MSDCNQYIQYHSRRDFLRKSALGLGGLALSSLINPTKGLGIADMGSGGILPSPHFLPKAKRVIYLFQSGGPSQHELFDYKPVLEKMNGKELPPSIRKGQRLTGMSSGQKSIPVVSSHFKFNQHGQSGAWVSEVLPHIGSVSDEICFIKSMYTEAINHDPAITFFQTGSQQPGRPSMGSWISYGLGSDNQNLPSFCVLLSDGSTTSQPLYSRLWGNGFLPSEHQGVQFRSGKDPVLFLGNPKGVTSGDRRRQLNYLKQLEEIQFDNLHDPEVNARIAQYEMAYRMQSSVPETMDVSGEPDYIYDMYGPDAKKPGTFAANCLLARRLIEKDVKFVQLYHKGWDHHYQLPIAMNDMAKSVDQPSAALIKDLKQRGLLEDTLVIWGGEFGRTVYSQGKLVPGKYGRDHHPSGFTVWMAGGGVKPGMSYGATDDFSYNAVENRVHVHDFQATIMKLMGIDHEKLIFKHQGRRFRLTDVHGHPVNDIIA